MLDIDGRFFAVREIDEFGPLGNRNGNRFGILHPEAVENHVRVSTLMNGDPLLSAIPLYLNAKEIFQLSHILHIEFVRQIHLDPLIFSKFAPKMTMSSTQIAIIIPVSR